MVYTQLVYGLVVATNVLTGSTLFQTNGAPLSINAPTAIEIFEAVNERAAAIWYPHTVVFESRNTIPFRYAETNRAGYQIGRFGLEDFDAYPIFNSGSSYLVTNGTFKAWSYNAFQYPRLVNPIQTFIPYVGTFSSSFQWQRAAWAIERMAPYFYQAYDATSATPWTASALWEAAGSTNGNPLIFDTDDSWDLFRHVGTSTVWILYRALTNMYVTDIPYPVTVSNILQYTYAATNVAAITLYEAGPLPAWASTNNGYYFELELTNSGVNLTNTVTGFTIPYDGLTNAPEAVDELVEAITFTGYGSWTLTGENAPDWYWAQVSNKVTTASKKAELRMAKFQAMPVGVTATVDWVFRATNEITINNFDATYKLSTTSFDTNYLVDVAGTGMDTNWGGTAVVTANMPTISSLMNLATVNATGLWSNAGVNQQPSIQVNNYLTTPREPKVKWRFLRCNP